MKTHCRLPFDFDAARLLQECSKIPPERWLRHFNTQNYEGEWSVLPLRSPGGNESIGTAHLLSETTFQDTNALAQCPYTREVIDSLECPKSSVRFMKLNAGSRIKEHRDYDLGFDAGEVRIHIPLITAPEVDFILNGERVVMQPGECWYLDFQLPHAIDNHSQIDRIHLVMDCTVNEWLKQLLETEGIDTTPQPKSSIRKEDLDKVIQALIAQNTETSLKLAEELQAQNQG